MNALVEVAPFAPPPRLRRAARRRLRAVGRTRRPGAATLAAADNGAMVYFHGDPRSTGARFVWRAGSGRRARHAPGTTATPPRKPTILIVGQSVSCGGPTMTGSANASAVSSIATSAQYAEKKPHHPPSTAATVPMSTASAQ